jgi:alpha-N-arabinofuranosidase
MPNAHVTLHPAYTIGPVRRELFGGFVEHLGRHIYDGIHEPSHPTAGPDGFRRDVVDLVRELGVTTSRYPGGNFVSGLRWEDSVGPVESRPHRLDLAWHSTEPNRVGMSEFATWLDLVGGEMMLAVNLGTRGVQEALDLLEYANVPSGSALAELRRRHGRDSPYDVTTWCLGNEMDGPWQLGHKDAESYGRLAAMTARAMRQLDPRVRLVASGSSGMWMPTFGEWERIVLTHAYDEVDYISAHAYYQETDGDAASFLASGLAMDRQIEAVIHAVDHVKQVSGSTKTIDISFDEWNVWYQDRDDAARATGMDDWPIAPRILEDRYNVTDAVVVGGLLISLLNHADRVTAASLAQLVNVIAPIMTEPGGPAWRQTTFHPFAETAAHARGTALRTVIDAPVTATTKHGDASVIDAAATRSDDGSISVFLVNRHLTETSTVTIDLTSPISGNVRAHGIWDEDRFAANSLEQTDRVALRSNESARVDGSRLTIDLPPVSWTRLAIG